MSGRGASSHSVMALGHKGSNEMEGTNSFSCGCRSPSRWHGCRSVVSTVESVAILLGIPSTEMAAISSLTNVEN